MPGSRTGDGQARGARNGSLVRADVQSPSGTSRVSGSPAQASVLSAGTNGLAGRRRRPPSKLCEAILTWMIDDCQGHVTTSSSEMQVLLAECSGLSVSISQRKQVRTGPASKKSRTPASRLSRALVIRPVDCSRWLRPLRLACVPAWNGPCQMFQRRLVLS